MYTRMYYRICVVSIKILEEQVFITIFIYLIIQQYKHTPVQIKSLALNMSFEQKNKNIINKCI